MGKKGQGEVGSAELVSIISRGTLVRVRGLALRRGVWFNALSRAERAMVDLTISFVKSVRSAELAKALTAIVIKLKRALESRVEGLVRSFGRSAAMRLSFIAQSWGNRLAGLWASDEGFSRYLAIMYLNQGLGVGSI
ncbi:MAG: hypothetical protein RMJ07_06925 [Nitrososphaerota archaeon]|nr:hypothetical protein [Candidatus Bathyarchaeota archaeon]MDW8049387.1 hypothetical protein [Nitrososphaerota archaeon]